MKAKKVFITIFAVLFVLGFSAPVFASDLASAGITPDSPFYFLKSWGESVRLFFTFGAENKAKQYLHLSEVRLAEYQKMTEKGKTEIAERTLAKYEEQLRRALAKAEELKQKGEDVEDLTQETEQAITKHLEVLQANLEKAPEQAQKGIQNAIENSQKGMNKILEKKTACTLEAKQCPDGSYVGRTGQNCEFAACPGQ
ncbi:MAG: DUF5667 domain-containing protein [bacterium]